MWKSLQVCAKIKINLHIKIAFLQEDTPNCNGLVGLKMVGLSFTYCSWYIFPIFYLWQTSLKDIGVDGATAVGEVL